MKTFSIQKTLWVPQSRDRVFAFFSDPRNLDRLTPDWLEFAIVTPATTAMKRGVSVDYRLRSRGIRLRWQGEIEVREPPYRCIDRQTNGPYRLWVHQHIFDERDNGTLVSDQVEYAVPGGLLVNKFLVAPDLEQIFKYRHRALEDLFN